MLGHDIVVVGASAGSIEALKTLVSGLPPTLPAALFIVLHVSPHSRSALPGILSRAGPLPAVHAVDGEAVRHNRIYIAPPDHHLVLEHGYVRVTRGPRENRARPAVDVLFRSAAYAYGPRVIGVILSGQLDDGTAGLWAIKDRGGLTVVQDPQDAVYSSMPESALRHVVVDHCLPIAEMAPLLVRLTGESAPEPARYPVAKDLEIETRIAHGDNALEAGVTQLGRPSPYTCPECQGTLLQIQQGDILRFRCHTGHAFSLSTRLAEAITSLERILGSALRCFDENLLLLQHLARHADERNDHAAAAYIRQKARDVEGRRALLQRAAAGHEELSADSLSRESEVG